MKIGFVMAVAFFQIVEPIAISSADPPPKPLTSLLRMEKDKMGHEKATELDTLAGQVFGKAFKLE